MWCRARLKQRLEASHEGVSTEDGSSSVTSGLDEDHALQADIMMRRLVKVRTQRPRHANVYIIAIVLVIPSLDGGYAN